MQVPKLIFEIKGIDRKDTDLLMSTFTEIAKFLSKFCTIDVCLPTKIYLSSDFDLDVEIVMKYQCEFHQIEKTLLECYPRYRDDSEMNEIDFEKNKEKMEYDMKILRYVEIFKTMPKMNVGLFFGKLLENRVALDRTEVLNTQSPTGDEDIEEEEGSELHLKAAVGDEEIEEDEEEVLNLQNEKGDSIFSNSDIDIIKPRDSKQGDLDLSYNRESLATETTHYVNISNCEYLLFTYLISYPLTPSISNSLILITTYLIQSQTVFKDNAKDFIIKCLNTFDQLKIIHQLFLTRLYETNNENILKTLSKTSIDKTLWIDKLSEILKTQEYYTDENMVQLVAKSGLDITYLLKSNDISKHFALKVYTLVFDHQGLLSPTTILTKSNTNENFVDFKTLKTEYDFNTIAFLIIYNSCFGISCDDFLASLCFTDFDGEILCGFFLDSKLLVLDLLKVAKDILLILPNNGQKFVFLEKVLKGLRLEEFSGLIQGSFYVENSLGFFCMRGGLVLEFDEDGLSSYARILILFISLAKGSLLDFFKTPQLCFVILEFVRFSILIRHGIFTESYFKSDQEDHVMSFQMNVDSIFEKLKVAEIEGLVELAKRNCEEGKDLAEMVLGYCLKYGNVKFDVRSNYQNGKFNILCAFLKTDIEFDEDFIDLVTKDLLAFKRPVVQKGLEKLCFIADFIEYLKTNSIEFDSSKIIRFIRMEYNERVHTKEYFEISMYDVFICKILNNITDNEFDVNTNKFIEDLVVFLANSFYQFDLSCEILCLFDQFLILWDFVEVTEERFKRVDDIKAEVHSQIYKMFLILSNQELLQTLDLVREPGLDSIHSRTALTIQQADHDELLKDYVESQKEVS
jgi:hypothetical protein